MFDDTIPQRVRFAKYFQVFPDSEIALKYDSASTKATCMLTGVLTPFLLEKLLSAMKDQLLSVWINGFNDIGLEKMNPITIQIYDVRSGKIVKLFWDMCETTSATTDVIYTALNKKIC